MKAKKPVVKISLNKRVESCLKLARKKYPSLSDAEILKVGLFKIAGTSPPTNQEKLDAILASGYKARATEDRKIAKEWGCVTGDGL